MIRLELPFPPSVNRYWRHVGSRVLISREGREYRQLVIELMRARKVKKHDGELIVDIRLVPADRRRRDVDNSLKALLDAMQAGGAYDDDSQIIRLTVEKVEPERDAPRSEIVVRHVPAKIGEPGYRICLRCENEFDSLGPANRLCNECTSWKNSLPGAVRVIRGVKRHNGEVIG
jgi:Holliday junction resolvase RusA-like endonuclease